MRILVTGSNGLLGQKISDLLAEEGIEFLATSSGENRNPVLSGDSKYRSLDITDPLAVDVLIQEFKPDYLINTAAMTNVDQCESEKEKCRALNIDAVKYLLDSCEKVGAMLVHLSTDFVFDGSSGPYKETDDPNPISYYGWSKLAAENLILASDKNHTILRTVLVYGIVPRMSRSNIVLWVKDSLEAGKQISVVNDQWRTPTLAEDLAKGCLLACQNNSKGIFHVSGYEMMSPFEIALKVADHFQLDKHLIKETDGSKFSQPAKRPPKTGFDISKANDELGYQPRSFKEGLELTGELILKYRS